MNAHTPGPWIVEPHSDEDELLYVAAGLTRANGIITATWIAECDLQSGDLEENAANARLIAAAPELLAALKRAVDTIHAWHDMPGGGTLSEADKVTAWRIYSTHAPEMQAINRAIAKAEGDE
jgi:hypothetical protein